MARYDSLYSRRSLGDGDVVWGYAFEETHAKDGNRLKQVPIRGMIVKKHEKPLMFIPFKKNSDTEFAVSKAVHIDSRNYADTMAEAVEGYNELISENIEYYKDKIKRLEGERVSAPSSDSF